MSKEAKVTWIDVLAAVRTVAPHADNAFMVDDVVGKVGIDPKEAARWITKFVDWGYAVRGGFEPGQTGRRPRRMYHITKYGAERELGSGASDIEKLLGAIQELRDAVGESNEKKALQQLFRIHDKVVEDRESRFKKKD